LLELAPARNGQSLNHDDSLAILQMIAASAAASTDVPSSTPWLDVVELLREPKGHSGDVFRVRGVVDRVTRIELADNPLARRLGLPHYYQLDIHVSIGDRRLNVASGKAAESLSFEDDYPVTLIAGSLPETLKPGGRQNVQIETSAFVYRMWSFASIKSRRIDPGLKQVVPLLVSGPIQVLAPSSRAFSLITAIVATAGLVGLIVFAWWFGGSRRSSQRGGGGGKPLPEAIDISQLP
jgi:hypothetical protein